MLIQKSVWSCYQRLSNTQASLVAFRVVRGEFLRLAGKTCLGEIIAIECSCRGVESELK
jgi:hypothetical protein